MPKSFARCVLRSRADEAGKGFAVVANEVKELAKETAKAAEDISRKIEGIQSDIKGGVATLASITSVINEVNSISSTTAMAVEEQNATTNEMARNLGEAARGQRRNREEYLRSGGSGSEQHARRHAKAAAELARLATSLRTLVAGFKSCQVNRRSSTVAEGAAATLRRAPILLSKTGPSSKPQILSRAKETPWPTPTHMVASARRVRVFCN